MCDNIIPLGKWRACEMIEKLQLRELGILKKDSCCIYSLHVAEFDLIDWFEGSLNDNMRHVVSIFLAIVSYYMVRIYKESFETVEPKKSDMHRVKYKRFVGFLREFWETGGNKEKYVLNAIRLHHKTPSSEIQILDEYLNVYLKERDIPLDVLEENLDFSFYDTLFEEYFTERRSQNIVHKWGRQDPAYNSSLVTVHTNRECMSCVGFVCYYESVHGSRNPIMQGIVSCPFYRAAFSNSDNVLGAANTILVYMETRIQKYGCKRLEVNPIEANEDWKIRLSKIPFIVNGYGERIEGSKEARQKRKRKLKQVVNDSNDSDSSD